MMTLRENAMAIYNRQQPDYYFDLMDRSEEHTSELQSH